MARTLTPEHRANISEGLRDFYAGIGNTDQPRSRRGSATADTHTGLSGFKVEQPTPSTVKPIAPKFRGHTTKYSGGTVDDISKPEVAKIGNGISEWMGLAKYNGELPKDTAAADFDMPAVHDAIVRSGLNVDFFVNGLDGGDYQIDDDTEWPIMGADLRGILEANRRVGVRPPAPNFATMQPQPISSLSNREYADVLSDFESMREAWHFEDLGTESNAHLISDLLRRGINIRGALPDSGVDEQVRRDIVTAIDQVYNSDD